MLNICMCAQSSFWMFAPSGKQAEELYKAAKEIARHADDVGRLVSKNPEFWESIPTWAWIIIGIIVVIIVIYAISES